MIIRRFIHIIATPRGCGGNEVDFEELGVAAAGAPDGSAEEEERGGTIQPVRI